MDGDFYLFVIIRAENIAQGRQIQIGGITSSIESNILYLVSDRRYSLQLGASGGQGVLDRVTVREAVAALGLREAHKSRSK